MASERATKRISRQTRVRKRVRGSDELPRLSVYRSLHHIYAQVISDESGRTLVSSSTLTPAVKSALTNARDVKAAKSVGQAIAAECLQKGIERVVFDRNGFLYHGRIKALADAAREAGLKF